ncbi:TRAP transporter large permease [Chloroflexota bacterium]
MLIPLATLLIMLILLFSGVLVGSALGISFFIGITPELGWSIFRAVGTTVFTSTTLFTMVAIPLFILLAELIVNSGLSNILYSAITKIILGIIPGGLLQVNLGTCTVFAALCGSSTAGAAAMGRLAYSEVAIKRKYDKALTIGTLTAGGTIGILIPPSIPMIVYGSFAEISISTLFLAGIIPGLILASLFSLLVFIFVKINPSLVGDYRETVTLGQRFRGILMLIPFGLLILLMLGSIYGGVATPTEAAGIGASGVIILMIVYRLCSRKVLMNSFVASAKLTSVIFFIFIGAQAITKVLAYYHIPPLIEQWSSGLTYLQLVLVICLIYLVLGCLFDGLSLLLVTLPFILPLAHGAGIDLYWLGILVTVLVEIGMLTPPVGMNLYVVQAVTKEPIGLVIRGSAPFIICQVIVAAILIAFPNLVLFITGG